MLEKFRNKLFEETPIYSLVFTRIAFGLIVLYDYVFYYIPGRIAYAFVTPKFHFKYYGFEWVKVLPEPWIYWLFHFTGFLCVLIVLGLFYRIAIILFILTFTYIFLLDQTLYLNHNYMVILFAILLAFMPANRYFSIDAHYNPKIRSNKISFWPIFLLRSQLEIILLFAGFVKLNSDWLIDQMPLKMWFTAAKNLPDFLYYALNQPWGLKLGAYGAIILHLTGAPLLLFRKTRLYAFAVYCVFHVTNSMLFNIGIFPWITIALTLIFFDTDWPKKLLRLPADKKTKKLEIPSSLKQNIIISLMAIWLLFQVLIPLRHYLYPGYVSWTTEGIRFAWRMMLSEWSGVSYFYVTDKETGEKWPVKTSRYLTPLQYETMQCQPDMILQYGHYLGEVWAEKGHKNVMVTTTSTCVFNGRKPKLMIDQDVDLSSIERSLLPSKWIKPYDPNTKWAE